MAAAAATMVVAYSPAFAAEPIVLTFEGIADQAAVGDYYNGAGGTN